MLAYRVVADDTDDYINIGGSTTLESLRRFATTVVQIFGSKYMRLPNNEHDTTILLESDESRCFWYAWFHILHALELQK